MEEEVKNKDGSYKVYFPTPSSSVEDREVGIKIIDNYIADNEKRIEAERHSAVDAGQ